MDNRTRLRATQMLSSALALTRLADEIADEIERKSLTMDLSNFPVALHLRYTANTIRVQCAELADALEENTKAETPKT